MLLASIGETWFYMYTVYLYFHYISPFSYRFHRYTKGSITAKNIYDALVKRVTALTPESAILAQMVWYENDDRLCVGYLDRLDLYAVLINGTKNLPPYW